MFESPLLPGVPVPIGDSPLSQLLAQLIAGGLTAIIVYRYLDTQEGKRLSAFLSEFLSMPLARVRRLEAVILSALISLAAYGVAFALGLVPGPGSVQGWADLVLALLGVSFTGSQVLHSGLRGEPGR